MGNSATTKSHETIRPYLHGAPELAPTQEWSVTGYLAGRATRSCPLKFSDFKTIQFIGRSGDYYHFIGDGRTILICTINFKIS